MYTVDVVTVVPATLERTWAALCDIEHWPDWQPIRSVTVDGHGGLGPRVEYTVHGRGIRDRYRVTEFGKDGTTRTVEWQDTKERQLIVGDRFEQLTEIQVSFFMDTFAAIGFMGAKLVIDYPDAPPQVKRRFEKLFTGPAKPEPFSWKVPRKPGGTGMYSYTVQWVRANGTSVTEGPVTQDGETVMIFPPVGA